MAVNARKRNPDIHFPLHPPLRGSGRYAKIITNEREGTKRLPFGKAVPHPQLFVEES